MTSQPHIAVIGAGIGGLTSAALLAKSGYKVTVFEANTYPGGCAGTFFHKGYRFDAGATIAGGFQTNGPHDLSGKLLGIDWKVKPHDPAWVVHLPDRSITLCQDQSDVIAKFPRSQAFWQEQQTIADLAWRLSAQDLPFPPSDVTEFLQLAKLGLRNLPQDLQIIPFAFKTVKQWAQQKGLADDHAFLRFLDAQLLISAQSTSPYVNALYGATALDLPRQGVVHVEGGIGSLAQQLADKVLDLGSEIFYRHQVTGIAINNRRASGLYVKRGKKSSHASFIPADFVLANLTPWSLDNLLGDASPRRLQQEVQKRPPTQGAFVMHVGLKTSHLAPDLEDHHQIISDMQGPLGEGLSIFVSMSPVWDHSRAPEGHRAVTISTHTHIQTWWDLLRADPNAYTAQKQAYSERIISTVEPYISGFKQGVELVLTGTPITYQFYTGRALGMVGGFPQTSLFKVRGPRTGIDNIRLVGDSIFPGQSTAGVTLGALRVAQQVQRTLAIKENTKTYTIFQA